MSTTEYQNSSFSISSFLRCDKVHSLEPETSHELELFQRQTADRFLSLSSVSLKSFLSLSWVCKLLDAFLCCQEEFRIILFSKNEFLNKPPMDKLMSEYLERSVKALDVCNAIRDGMEQVRQWEKQLEIVMNAFYAEKNRSIGKGQFGRAKKALYDLASCMVEEKDSNSRVSHRNRSIGRNDLKKESKSLGHFRSLSWSVSPGWSATKQIHAIGNISVPKSNELLGTNGLAVAVYTMSSVLHFVMWVLVAAIPCQDRGLTTHFNISKQFLWASPILSIQNRILEESKKRDMKNSCGLLREICRIEVCATVMNELIDSVQFPMSKEKEREVKERVDNLGELLEAMKKGINPLNTRVREAFRRIVRIRTEGHDWFK